MNKEQYLEQRKELMNKASKAIEDGDVKAAKQSMNSVKELDDKFEEISTAKANLDALIDKAPVATLDSAPIPTQPLTPIQNAQGLNQSMTDSTPSYEHAWAKAMLGQTLDSAEQAVFDKANERLNAAGFSASTTNTTTLIPNTVVAGIWKIAEGQYPLFADAKKYNVRGTLTINKHDGIVAGDAQWVDEATQADDEQNTFAQLVLKGFELNKVATVTWKMKDMGEEDFVAFLTQELGDRLGVALGTAIHSGDGTTAPKGVESTLKAEDGTPQVVSYTDNIVYKNITDALSRIDASFAGKAVIYANSKTIWNQLANIVDGQGRPLFIANLNAGGVGNILGILVKPDAGAADGDVLVGDAPDTLIVNVNQAVTVAQEDHVKGRTTDYGAYAISDSGLLTTKGFALLTPAPKA